MAYSKTTWQNGVTPINETNLNKIENELQTLEQDNIIVSSTEPVSDKRKVWIQKGKNLFNKNNVIPGFLNVEGNVASPSYNEVSSNFIPITKGQPYITFLQDYTIPSGGQIWLAICLYDENKNFITRYADYNIDSISINSTQTANACYVRVSFRYNDNNIKCQLEQGTVASNYEAYIDKKIYIKNDNNVYEKFYNENYTQEVEDFQNKVTFNETIGSFNSFKRNGKIISITFQGQNKAHNLQDLLFILPAGYRPTSTIVAPFTGYGTVYGNIQIGAGGDCMVTQINSTSISARLIFNLSFILD